MIGEIVTGDDVKLLTKHVRGVGGRYRMAR